MAETRARARFIERLPKAELHVHLEGAIQPSTLLTLARRRGVDLPAENEDRLREFFEFRDFEHFVQVYLLCSRCLRDPEDFQLVAEDFLAEQERQRIFYTEAHLTISTHLANGVNGGEVADALSETIGAAERDRGVRLRLIADIVRNVPYDRADQTLEWALAYRDQLVVALGVSGIESWPLEPFRAHFREAERQGLARVAHAGEQTGPDDVRGAIEVCRPQRLGHGIRAVEDPALVAELADRELPLEVSLTSNVQLKNAAGYSEHPLLKLREAGVLFSINSDDPVLFGTSLNEEYERAGALLDLDLGALGELALAALDQSFLDAGEHREFRSRYGREIQAALEGFAG